MLVELLVSLNGTRKIKEITKDESSYPCYRCKNGSDEPDSVRMLN